MMIEIIEAILIVAGIGLIFYGVWGLLHQSLLWKYWGMLIKFVIRECGY